VKRNYHVVSGREREAERAVAAFCRANGQVLLPLVELVEQARLAVDTVIEQLSQQTLETILHLSAQQLAGARTPGQASGEIRWYGRQAGRVSLQDRQVAVRKPRLRRKGKHQGGEVAVPAYEALRRNPALGARMFGALLRGVSTRQYHDVLPQMAATVGVSKSAVSREAIEASAAQLSELLERRWEEVDLLVIYLDGQQFGDHHVISAVGVDIHGRKHVLGHPRRGHGERRSGESVADSPARARGEHGEELSVRDRRGQGAARGDPRSVRRGAAGAALPDA